MTCNLDDDEGDIEAEIQRELDALEVDSSLQIEDVEDYNLTLNTNESNADDLPHSIKEYLRLLHSRTEVVNNKVKECDIVLETLPSDDAVKEDEDLLARRIKEELGEEYEENPLVLRDQVLSELEEAELQEEREKLATENKNEENNKFALDIIRPGVIEEIQALEEKAQQELKELEKKQAEKEQEREKWYQDRKQEEDERRKREKECRVQRQAEFEAAQKVLLKEQEALQAKLEREAKEEEKKLNEMEKSFQAEIEAMEEERRIQKDAFVDAQRKEAEYQKKKQESAATKIQNFFRGFRVRKQYQPLLKAKKGERIRKRNEELDRIERVEKKLREETERKKIEDERKKREEEEERQRQEQAEKERKLKEEQRIREEEKKQKEEQERKRVLEEEKRIKEEEAMKKREEERQREAELRRKLEEESRKKAEEDARKKHEEEEKRREAELKRKLEEKKRKAEEEARKKREEEEKLREAQLKKKLEEENRREEERRKLEEMKKKELEEKRREDEKRRMEKEERKIEAERKTLEEERKLIERKEETKRRVEATKAEVEQVSQINSSLQDLKDKSGPGLALTKELEARRLQWVKEHTPWRIMCTAEERTHPVAFKSRPRRAFSASKRLPALTEEQLLKSAPPNTPLFRLKCIVVRDAQSCRMDGLYKCPEVQSLTLHNCGLLAVEGLEKCTELQELYVENNQIEAINCKDLTKLEDASFANNNLTSVHGLEGCPNVVTLDLSNNRITRIGDLSSCSKMQCLSMDNNQLINTKGLSCLTNLQHLSLAHNHLARVNDLDKAALLQSLNLQGNNLQQPPQLTHCVLLRELKLDDNSLSSLDSLSSAWLPLLRCLSVSQNSVSQLPSLGNLIMLKTLDISNNLISDTDSLIPGLQGCNRLKTLKIEGNPVHEDPDCRTFVLEALPSLRWFDSEKLSAKKEILETNQGGFVGLCLSQLQSQDALESKHERETSLEDIHATDPNSVSKRLSLKQQRNKEKLDLAVTHLLEHENFNPDKFAPSVKDETVPEGIQFKTVAQNKERTDLDKELEGGDKTYLDPQLQRHVAATKIQALWRGWHIRYLIDVNTTKWLAAVSIQSAWRGYLVRSWLKRKAKETLDPKRNSAATVIQAHFRGQRVRRRLAEALKAAQFYDEKENGDFDYDEEVDLTAFDFDETVLEQGWTPSDTPQLPSRGPVLRMPTQSSKISTTRSRRDIPNESTVPKPRHAWRSADSPIIDVNQAAVARTSIDHDQMSVASGAQSHLSHRAEELSNEWGFQSSGTAEMMLKRAKKMKYNPARRKKLLDPNKRLALFKKLEETNKLRDVRPPPTKRQPPNRIDYFAARQAMATHLTSTSPASEQHNREQMTYSWVYKQAVVHEDEEKNIMAGQKEFAPENKNKKTSPLKTNRSPVNLPHMDPVVLSGRTLPLISSPLFSQSVEEASCEGPSPRRNSLSSEGHVRFPAIKTHSVPNLLARSTASGDQSIRTEKSNSAGARINRDARNKR